MRVSEIKKGVYAAFSSVGIADKVDEQLLSCLLYDVVRRVLSSDQSQQNDVRSLAGSYLPGMRRNFEEFKVSFISYTQMRAEAQAFGHSTFLGFTSQQIARVNSLYRERVEIVPFSSVYFSQYMYRVSNLRDADYRRLSSAHKRVMAPIAKFYSDQYGKSDSDLEVIDSLVYPDKPGKEILFSVKDVEPSRVVADIRTSRIPVSSGLDMYKVQGKYVKIVIK